MKPTTMGLPIRFIALLTGTAMFVLAVPHARAAGTPAGTTVSNTASLTYSVGGVGQPAILASASFLVDNKINMTVTRLNATVVAVVPGQLAALSTFTVTNNGNATQDFALAGADMTAGTANPFGGALLDSFIAGTGGVCTISNIGIATGTMGTFTAGDQHINALTADSSATVTVSCAIPGAQANGTLAVISLTATARINDGTNALGGALISTFGTPDIPGTVQVVFADIAGPAVGDVANNAAHSALNAYLVQTGVLTLSKSVSVVCDPARGTTTPKNIPGAAVQYAITITNAGSAAATLTTVTDTLATVLGHDINLISGVGGAAVCVAGAGGQVKLAPGVGFGAVKGTGATTYTPPGLAANAVTAGVTILGQDITITFNLLSTVGGGLLLPAGSLPVGDFVTVYYNAFVQ